MNLNCYDSDEHGFMDVRLEKWDNLRIRGDSSDEIQGGTLNILLRGVFSLFSDSKSLISTLPLNLTFWSDVAEYLLVSIMTLATVEQILGRIFLIVDEFCNLECIGNVIDDISIGAILFLYLLVKEYSSFISVSNFLLLYNSIIKFTDSMEYLDSFQRVYSRRFAMILAVVHKQISSYKDENLEEIKVIYSAGEWNSEHEEKLRSLKEQRSSKPVPTISIFGITPDLLDELDSSHDSTVNAHAVRFDRPLPRVSLGFQLLQETPSQGWKIFDFDKLEIARQWTLLDHSSFLSIPLSSLHMCQWTDSRHFMKGVEVRAFIDIFNAQSCWVAQCILQADTPSKRCKIYADCVDVAVYLESLNNFNGAMAIITALQQGCISRLKDTVQLLSPSTVNSLRRLQVLLSGNKNYFEYRECLGSRIQELNSPENNKNDSNKAHHASGLDASTLLGGASAVVPHLGAHLAEYCTVEEGNSNFLPDAPYLINVEKMKLNVRISQLMQKMQRFRYCFSSVRVIQSTLLKCFTEGQYLSTMEATLWSRRMYNKSSELEFTGNPKHDNDSDRTKQIFRR